MDITKIKTFYEVVKTKSTRGAATNLKINASLVTRNLAVLESEIGHKLFENLKQRIVLTPKGKEFFKYAEQALSSYHGVLERLNLEDKEPAGWLTISATNAVTHMSLIRDIAEFLEQKPKLKINIFSQQDSPDLILGKADIVITAAYKEDEYTEYKYLTSFKQHLYASENYLKFNGTPKNIEDLKDHKMLGYQAFVDQNFTNNVLNWQFKLTETPLEPSFIINSGFGLIQATDLGLGIATLTHISPKYSKNKLLRVLPELEGPEIKVYFTCLKHIKDSPKVLELFEFLKKKMNNVI